MTDSYEVNNKLLVILNAQTVFSPCEVSTYLFKTSMQAVPVLSWNPSHNRNHLYDIVLPEVERRGVYKAFIDKLEIQLYPKMHCSISGHSRWILHTAPCDLQARCALAVLEEAASV